MEQASLGAPWPYPSVDWKHFNTKKNNTNFVVGDILQSVKIWAFVEQK